MELFFAGLFCGFILGLTFFHYVLTKWFENAETKN